MQRAVYDAIHAALIEARPTQVISGMALGVDQIAVRITLALSIPLVAAVPFPGQEAPWPPSSRDDYTGILSQATRVVFVAQPPYAAWKLQRRNEWMVDRADVVWAVWDGSPTGGTANAISYAERQSKPVRNLWSDVQRRLGTEPGHA